MHRAPRTSQRLVAASCLAALTLGGIAAAPAALAAPAPDDAEALLASLDDDQLAVLDRLATLQVSGLQDLDDDVLDSDEPVDVIVSLTQPPATTARLLAATQGQTLTDAAAQDAVEESQDSFDDALAEAFPTSRDAKEAAPKVDETYTDTFNGVSMTVPGTELEALADVDGVAAVWPDEEVHATSATSTGTTGTTTATTEVDDQEAIAAGLAKLHDEGVTGKGITVGVIDTGIDYHHPDLAAVYAGGVDLVDGDDDPMETTYADWKASNQAETNQGSTYYTEHGTHVAGIIAGQGDTATERAAHGVAPDAKIRAYRVLGPYGGGYTSTVLAGMDAALQDDVDVVNMSLGAASNDPMSPQSLAADHMVLAGITTVIAAGNSGPTESSLGTPGAAALPITVGANDTPMQLARYQATIAGTTAEARLLASSYADVSDAVDGAHGVVQVGLGRSADYSGKDVAGKIAVVERGTITLNEKVERAADKGAAAVLLVNNVADEGHIPNYLGESTGFVPTFSVTAADGAAIADALAADPAATAAFAADGTFTLGGDQLASFSSRGPVYGTGTIKPEITAPGVSIMSSVPVDVVDPEGDDYSIAYARLSGTSMATPYVAGVAALLLQDDPKRTPADVKVALMNTAAPLEGTDDVFGVGAGQVDPWAAVHASVSAAVQATTTQVDAAGESSTLRHETGAVDFGTKPSGRAVLDTTVVEVQGHAKGLTRYDVAVSTTGTGPDPAKNRVKVSVQKSLTLVGSAKRHLPILLTAPASAAAGSYQGVVTLTPRDTDLPTLRLPFGVRLAKTGLTEMTMPKAVLSTHQGTGDGLAAGGQGQFAFTMAGQLTELRIFLADQKGKDIGFVGSLSTVGLAQGVSYGASFTGSYFPLTGDKHNPVSPRSVWAAEGGYRFKVIGVDAYGHTSTKTAPVYVDTTAPTYSDDFGAFDPAVPTVVERPADATTYPLDGVLTDTSVPAIQAAGIDVDQSDNQLQWSIYSANVPDVTAHPDAEGTVHGELTFPKGPPVTTMYMWPADAAGNWADRRKVNFIKEGLPYVVGAADTAQAGPGDVVTYTLTAHDLKAWGTFKTQFRYDTNLIKLLSVEPTAELTAHDPSAVDLTTKDAGYGQWELATASFDVGDTAGLTADEMPLLTVSYEVLDDDGWTLENSLATASTSFTDVAGTTAQLQQFYGSVARYNARTSVSGRVALEALLTPGYAFDPEVDHTTAGIEVTLTAPDGTVRTTDVDATSRYGFGGLPLTDEAYTIEVSAPGHFTWRDEVAAGAATEGGQIISQVPSMSAGDVNGDDVVDVRDALAILKAKGSDDVSADIDRSGTVDRADLAWVRTNYLAQNPTSDRITTPVTTYRGSTLEDVEDRM